MNKSKIRVAVIYGGTSTEHEVSLVSARSVMSHLSPQKFSVIPVKITKQNQWLVDSNPPEPVKPFDLLSSVDVAFPVLHGPYGEDGTIQGLFEMAKVPYVGCGVLSSALCMDKVIQKELCRAAGIQVAKYMSVLGKQWQEDELQITKKIESNFSYPFFVKPANQGSSVGISKVHAKKELSPAIEDALQYDHKILVELAVPNPVELEVSVLGNDRPEASVVGQIVPSNEFYDYDAKYVDGKSEAIIPAPLDPKLANSIRTTALKAYKILNCSGLARVDFLLNSTTDVFYVNELNSMPGFTSISMYPKLWAATGLEYSKLLEKLIQLGIERFELNRNIRHSYKPKANWYS